MRHRFGWRVLSAAALLLLLAVAWPQGPLMRRAAMSRDPVLVLIQGERFEPPVEPDAYIHPTWIKWPAPSGPVGSNRLLSLLSNLDWSFGLEAFGFEPLSGTGWRIRNLSALNAVGWFRSRRALLGGSQTFLLTDSAGNVQRPAQALALGSDGDESSRRIDSPWPPNALGIISARSGDDVAAVVRRTSGPVLVVEYPPPARQDWSRIWLVGKTAWPKGLPYEPRIGVPGLLRANAAVPLMLRPHDFPWRPAPRNWAGANRWLAYLQRATPFYFLFFGFVAAGLAIGGFWFASQEQNGPGLSLALRIFAMAPAATVLGGNIALYAGLPGASIWILVSLAVLSGASALLARIVPGDLRSEPLFAWGLVGFLVLWFGSPTYSLFSPIFARTLAGDSGFYLGALLAYFIAAVRPVLRLDRARIGWLCGLALVLLLPLALHAIGWQGGLSLGFAPVDLCFCACCFPAGVVSSRLAFVAPAILMLGRVIQTATFGFAFLPNGLVATDSQAGATNIFDLASFLVSPGFLGLVFLVGSVALFASAYLSHRIKAALRRPPLCAPSLRIAAFLAVGGIWSAVLLQASLVLVGAAVLVLLETLVRPAMPL